MFTSDIIRKIKYYVYLLSDPISGEIFYVGKGKGNRVFSHLKDNTDNQKSRKIKDLKSKGLEPKIEFLVHGVDDEITIKKIEASIIDLIGKNKLTNIVGGYESSDFGRMDLAQIRGKYSSQKAEIKENVMLIKLSKTFRYNMDPRDLYDNTRGVWKVAEHRRKEVDYAFAVYDGIIQETYKILQWFEAWSTFNNREDFTSQREKDVKRWEFVGNVSDEMSKKYLYKSVEHKEQNPIKYTF